MEEFVHYESRPKKNENEELGFSRSYILSQHRLYISFFICIAFWYPLIYAKDWLLGTSCLLSGGGGVLNKFFYGEAPPRRSNPLPFYMSFSRKRSPFGIPYIDESYPFHIPCLELCIPFNLFNRNQSQK